MTDKPHDYLKRLSPEHYRGHACVHWSMTIEDRQTGWLIPIFYYKFRELLTHTMFRFGIGCPIFCLMPDHLHLLWMGLVDSADQRLAMKYLRGQINLVLEKRGFQLQDQPFDHVLREDERKPVAFQNVVEYIARNPERKQLVPPDGFRAYPYTGCLLPGYPDLKPFQSDFWTLFDALTSKLRREGLAPHP